MSDTPAAAPQTDAPRQVRYVNADGFTTYNMLLDAGGDTLLFTGAHGGHVVRHAMEHAGYTLVAGWLTLAEFDAERRVRWPHLCRSAAPGLYH